MELIDVVNEKDEIIEIKDKDAVHRDGNWHRASRIWAMNSKGEILIHQRAKKKKLCPGLWDTTLGGHVLSGETYEDAAKRELKEELGIKNFKLFEIGKWKGNPNESSPFEKLIVNIFLAKFDDKIEHLEFDKNEISQLRFIKLFELEKIYKNNIERNKFVYMGDFEERIGILKTFAGK